MLNIFNSVIASTGITPAVFIILVLISLGLGGILALIHTYKNDYTKSFVMTLAILPAVVAVVILMVNGNIGAGVAVAGAFSLVRFRSAPGNGQEITSIFLAMAVGLATGMSTGLIMGMGYIGYAVLFTALIGIAMLVFAKLSLGEKKTSRKILKITIPESLDYSDVFDDILKTYTKSYRLNQVKTSNMGSLFKLSYEIVMTDGSSEKEFIDKLRTRNGNLEISVSEYQTPVTDQL